MAAQVFISYSSKDDAAVELRDAVRQALKDAGYEVFVDKWDITPGTLWGQAIRIALAESHAAVILFSKSTLNHDYVLYEAGILSLRCHLDKDFKLIPVLFEEVKPEHLKRKRFSPLAIADIQSVKITSTQQIVEKIRDLLGPAGGRVGHKTVVDSLADQIALELGELPTLRLKQLAARLNLQISVWSEQRGVSEIATELTRLVLREGMAGVEKCIRTLINTRVAEPKPLVNLLSPLWVRHEAAGRIPQASHHLVALNGAFFDFTARMYLLRAVWPDQAIELCSVSEPHGEDRVAYVTNEIANYVMATRPMYKKPTQALEYLRRQKVPLYVTLPPPVPAIDELEKLLAAFPNVTFLLHTGEKALDPTHLPGIVEPLPELAPNEEQDACDRYSNILGLLNGLLNAQRG
jgi:hypothetical protein